LNKDVRLWFSLESKFLRINAVYPGIEKIGNAGYLQNVSTIFAGRNDSCFYIESTKFLDQGNGGIENFYLPCAQHFREDLIFSVSQTVKSLLVRLITRITGGNLDFPGRQKINHSVETWFSIHMFQIIGFFIERSIRLVFPLSFLLQKFVEHLFPGCRMKRRSIGYHTVQVKNHCLESITGYF
jgi:hypothetical protein